MTAREPSADRSSAPEEASTASTGTPAPVDVSADTRAVTTVAVLLAGPVISSLHFALVYLVVEAGCTGDGPGLDVADPPVPTVVTLAATAVAALACAGIAWWAWARWRAPSRSGRGDSDVLVDRQPLAFGGLLLAVLGLLVVLFVGLPAFWLPACG